ncbi:DUF2490 domain-containing protein [Fulvivirga ligni]|uniref:DUF2490 domain-containing protein n=1 Tax=Fulvivirga ligni TaxID=2904246 RepID=UPI001F1EC2AC|nr:DUF2490 domain-containing protein [Fulvivirga ligni]UII22243.1 DUF2490 domain-containing protein [Fulvivirga ligni]
MMSLFLSSAKAQEDKISYEPGVSVNYKIKSRWSANTSLGARLTTLEDAGTVTEFFELSQFFTYHWLSNVKLSAGYKYRYRDPFEEEEYLYEHRLTQQISWAHSNLNQRYASRLRVDERWQNDNYRWRFRYRFSLDAPLSGEELNPKEFYAMASNELLYTTGKTTDASLDNRLTAGVGYLLAQRNKLEFNFQWRSNDLFSNLNHVPFLQFNYYIQL